MSACRTLGISPGTVHWGYLDGRLAPVITVADGEVLRIETVSGGPRTLPASGGGFETSPDHLRVLEHCRPELGLHILTGPIAIAGAEPGDRLILRILSISLRQNWGWNAIEPGFGLLPDIPERYDCVTAGIDRDAGRIRLPWGVVVAARPFFGILAVAPALSLGRITSVVPGPFGGNIDCRMLVAGTELHLPVFRPGALFSVGDGHAAQGDGEVCDTAIETALSGVFSFHVQRANAPEFPEAHTQDAHIAMAVADDLDTAAKEATRRMIVLLQYIYALSRTDAYRHCSICSSLRVTQAVNMGKGVHMIVPRLLA